MADEAFDDLVSVIEEELFAQLAVRRLGLDFIPERERIHELAVLVADELKSAYRFQRKSHAPDSG